MFWVAAAAVAEITLPTPVRLAIPDVRAVFSADDMPAYFQRAGISRTVYSRTTVDPTGKTKGCVVERLSGDPAIDALTCAIIVKRAKFLPATWTDGSPVYGVIRVPIRWQVVDILPSQEDGLRATIPDIDLTVNKLPKGAHSIVGLSLKVAADETGRPVTCAENRLPPSKKARDHYPELVPIACNQVLATMTLTPPTDDSKKPMRSVQSVSVHFTIGS